MNKLLPILVSILLLLSINARAKTSKEYALMSAEVWSAFSCSVLASKSKNKDEQERLFKYGYKHGLIFINAINSGKVNQEDISSNTPIGVAFLLQGPTADFMLGRIYEYASDEALKEVYKSNGKYNSEDIQTSIATNEFLKRNCKLIGR